MESAHSVPLSSEMVLTDQLEVESSKYNYICVCVWGGGGVGGCGWVDGWDGYLKEKKEDRSDVCPLPPTGGYNIICSFIMEYTAQHEVWKLFLEPFRQI